MFFNEIEEICELEKINPKTKLNIIEAMSKKELQIITPLCPDYEHVSLGMGLYKYTFNKLNDGLGLIGKRLSKILKDYEKNKNLEQVISTHKPPIFWKDKDAVKTQVKAWSSIKSISAMDWHIPASFNQCSQH